AGDRGLEALCDGADAVFHLAGATSSLSSAEQMHESNVVATTNLVAAARSTGVGRFVHMGSTSVYGEEVPLPQPILESVEPHPSRGYGKAKWLAETAVWAAVADGLPAVVLRPVAVFGPGAVKLLASAILDVAIESFAGRRAIDIEAAPVELRLVHVADIVGVAIHLAEAEGAEGQAYNVVAPWYPSSVELAGMLAALFAMPVEETDRAPAGLSLEARRKAWETMLASGMQQEIPGGEHRLRWYLTAQGLPGEEAASLARNLHRLKQAIFLDLMRQGAAPLRAGIDRLLDELAAAAIRVAVATTAGRTWVGELLGTLLGPERAARFEAVGTSEHVARRKPDPEVYRIALDRLGCPAASALAIEDSKAGVAAA